MNIIDKLADKEAQKLADAIDDYVMNHFLGNSKPFEHSMKKVKLFTAKDVVDVTLKGKL